MSVEKEGPDWKIIKMINDGGKIISTGPVVDPVLPAVDGVDYRQA